MYAYGSNTAYETVTHAYNVNYDAQGDYHDTVTDSLAGTTDYEYDVNGNLIKLTSPQGTVNYSYDLAAGVETKVSSPDPVTGTLDTDIHYVHDAAGELISVTVNSLDDTTLSSPLVTTYGYDLDGNLVSTQDANGVVETRSYDVLNRATSIADAGAFGTIASFAYTYDPAGNMLMETDFGGRTDSYSQDNLGRLTQQVISDPVTGSSTLSPGLTILSATD